MRVYCPRCGQDRVLLDATAEDDSVKPIATNSNDLGEPGVQSSGLVRDAGQQVDEAFSSLDGVPFMSSAGWCMPDDRQMSVEWCVYQHTTGSLCWSAWQVRVIPLVGHCWSGQHSPVG